MYAWPDPPCLRKRAGLQITIGDGYSVISYYSGLQLHWRIPWKESRFQTINNTHY